MIYSKKDAKRLGRSNTIDLRAIILAEEGFTYIGKGKLVKIRNEILKYISICGIIFYLIVLIYHYGDFHLIIKTNAYSEKNYYIKGIKTELPKFVYDNVKIECNNQKTRNIHHCIKTTLAVNYAESTWNKSINFGIRASDNNIKGFVTRYNKYWYKSKGGDFFYGGENFLGKSHYCVNEDSSKSTIGCPNGTKNFNYIFLDQNLDVFIKKYMK